MVNGAVMEADILGTFARIEQLLRSCMLGKADFFVSTDLMFSLGFVILFNSILFTEARNSFFGLEVYLLKSEFRIEDKLRFP